MAEGIEPARILTGMIDGVVLHWRGEEGWGVIESPETPGGCWAHFSAIDVAGFRELAAGQVVSMEVEPAAHDGYSYRATRVVVPGAEPSVTSHGSTGAYTSSITFTFDDDLTEP